MKKRPGLAHFFQKNIHINRYIVNLWTLIFYLYHLLKSFFDIGTSYTDGHL